MLGAFCMRKMGENMNCIKIDLPKELTEIEIHTLADLHMGDKFCDYQEINRQIEAIKNTPNAYCILNGDLMNNATKTSISDSYAEQLTPMQQIGQAVELLKPIRDKILSIQSGNHEKRTYRKEGIDLTEIVARELFLLDRYSRAGTILSDLDGIKTESANNGIRYMLTMGAVEEEKRVPRLLDWQIWQA